MGGDFYCGSLVWKCRQGHPQTHLDSGDTEPSAAQVSDCSLKINIKINVAQ